MGQAIMVSTTSREAVHAVPPGIAAARPAADAADNQPVPLASFGESSTTTTTSTATGLLDLPDHLLGLLFEHLRGDRAARRALYSSCRACRESPAINQQLALNPCCAKLLKKRGSMTGQWVLTQLEHWPRYAGLYRLNLDGDLGGILAALGSLPARTLSKLQDVQELTVGLCFPEDYDRLLGKLLEYFPDLWSLSLGDSEVCSEGVQALTSAPCASTLCKLGIYKLHMRSTEEAHAVLQQLAGLSGLEELLLLVVKEPSGRGKKQPAGEQAGLDVSPLAALTQLQKLHLSLERCCLHVGSLHALAAGCRHLTHLALHFTEGGVRLQEASTAVTVAARGGTWPALQEFSARGLEPGEAAGLLASAFCSCPNLVTTCVDVRLRPDTHGSSAGALGELCKRAAALPGRVEHMRLAWPYTQQDRQLMEPAAHMLSALQPLRGRVVALGLMHLRLLHGDVAALAAALGNGLQELWVSGCSGPVGAVASEAAAGLPGLEQLYLPRHVEEPGWEGKVVEACVTAQMHPRRTAHLAMAVTAFPSCDTAKLQQRWAEAWSALPQPQAGPMRVKLV